MTAVFATGLQERPSTFAAEIKTKLHMIHEHHHHHHDEEEGNGRLIKIISSTVLLIAASLIEKYTALEDWQYLLIFLVPYLIVGYDTLKEALEGLLEGEALSEDFLMSVATLGALGIGFMPGAETQFAEAVFVMLFFQVGEWFEERAEGKSRKSISNLMDIRPDIAHVERDGKLHDVAPESVQPGEIIVIRPGEKVPMDGTVIEGASSLDTVALTGESVPRGITMGDEILSGCVNLNGMVRHTCSCWFGGGCGYCSGSHNRRVEHMDIPWIAVPGGIVPLRAGDIGPSDLLWRSGRGLTQGYPY